jgi:hypothetical protein
MVSFLFSSSTPLMLRHNLKKKANEKERPFENSPRLPEPRVGQVVYPNLKYQDPKRGSRERNREQKMSRQGKTEMSEGHSEPVNSRWFISERFFLTKH